MKCTHCGLPLSPTSTSKSCPRCHSSLVSGPVPKVQQPQEQVGNQAWVGNAWQPARAPGVMYSTPAPAARPHAPRMRNLGFIVAALCVISGGLILRLCLLLGHESTCHPYNRGLPGYTGGNKEHVNRLSYHPCTLPNGRTIPHYWSTSWPTIY